MFKLISILILSLITTPCFAQEVTNNALNGKGMWVKNGIVVNNSVGRSIRQNPRTVTLGDGSSITVWEDFRNGFTDIYAQRLDSTGAKLWGDDGVAVCKAEKNQTFPQIIQSGTSDAVIVWQDYRNDNSDIYAQKIDLNGNTLWADDGIPVCRAPYNQLAPQLAPDNSGGAIIVWYDYRSGKGEDIYAQKINSSGGTEWRTDGVAVCSEEGTQWYPQIVSDGSGGAVICWDDKRGEDFNIYAQRLDIAGNPVWQAGGIAVCAAPENQQYCQMAPAGKDSFVITWQDYRNGNADIYAQKIDVSGRMIWRTNGVVVCNVVGNQEKPQVVGGENPVIVWTDYRNGTGNSDIYCQQLSSEGSALWDPYGVAVCGAGGNQMNPKAVSDGDGGAVILWQDNRNPLSSIYGRRVNKDGKALWAPDGKTICNDGSGGEFPQIAASGNGTFTAVWQDRRNGGLDVYAQELDGSGAISWIKNGTNIVLGFGAVTQQKPQMTKSGTEEYIIVWEDYRNGYSNLYAQKINNKGKVLWNAEGKRVCVCECNQMNPVLVSDDNGGAIIAWEDSRVASNTNILVQRLDGRGNALWNEEGVVICKASGDKLNPKITYDGKGGAIIAWQDSRRGGEMYDVYAQRIDKSGASLWRMDGVDLSSSPSIQVGLKMAHDGESGAIVTWVEYKKNLNIPDIYAQRVSSTGTILWDMAGCPVCRAPETQRNPEVAVNGEIIITWEDSGSGNYDIYAQKISKDGTVAWQSDGIAVCTAPYTQHEPKLVLNGDGGATITWEDYRKANWDIYAQRIDNDGKQVWTKDGIEVCGAPGTQYAPQIIKNMDKSCVIVWEDYRNNKSYNIYSQKVSPAGDILWAKDGLVVCATDGGARNPQVVDDGHNGAVIVWTDYRYGSYDIYAQRINDIPN